MLFELKKSLKNRTKENLENLIEKEKAPILKLKSKENLIEEKPNRFKIYLTEEEEIELDLLRDYQTKDATIIRKIILKGLENVNINTEL